MSLFFAPRCAARGLITWVLALRGHGILVLVKKYLAYEKNESLHGGRGGPEPVPKLAPPEPPNRGGRTKRGAP